MSLTRDDLIYLTRIHHLQYLGLVSRVRAAIAQQAVSKPLDIHKDSLTYRLVMLGKDAFTRLRAEMKPLRAKEAARVKAAAKLQAKADRAAYMRQYRKTKREGVTP